mmetsp:Transcript_1400/g.5002  ORF Transcript_1400/g.5002 Transcript_1400/m.5002 type:complete len:220 (-) Transcript_1400:178-837(-)
MLYLLEVSGLVSVSDDDFLHTNEEALDPVLEELVLGKGDVVLLLEDLLGRFQLHILVQRRWCVCRRSRISSIAVHLRAEEETVVSHCSADNCTVLHISVNILLSGVRTNGLEPVSPVAGSLRKVVRVHSNVWAPRGRWKDMEEDEGLLVHCSGVLDTHLPWLAPVVRRAHDLVEVVAERQDVSVERHILVLKATEDGKQRVHCSRPWLERAHPLVEVYR